MQAEVLCLILLYEAYISELEPDIKLLTRPTRGVCVCTQLQLYCMYVYIPVCLFLTDMDVGSWLPADGFIQVECKHRALPESSLCPCVDHAALSLR